MKLEVLTAFKESGLALRPSSLQYLLELGQGLPLPSPFRSTAVSTAGYGVYSIPELGWKNVRHNGIDIVPSNGDLTVIAQAGGTPVEIGISETLGKYLIFMTDSGIEIKYAHLETIYFLTYDEETGKGDVVGVHVPKGTRLAKMGETGTYAVRPHLHIEIRIEEAPGVWTLVNPEKTMDFIGGT